MPSAIPLMPLGSVRVDYSTVGEPSTALGNVVQNYKLEIEVARGSADGALGAGYKAVDIHNNGAVIPAPWAGSYTNALGTTIDVFGAIVPALQHSGQIEPGGVRIRNQSPGMVGVMTALNDPIYLGFLGSSY